MTGSVKVAPAIDISRSLGRLLGAALLLLALAPAAHAATLDTPALLDLSSSGNFICNFTNLDAAKTAILNPSGTSGLIRDDGVVLEASRHLCPFHPARRRLRFGRRVPGAAVPSSTRRRVIVISNSVASRRAKYARLCRRMSPAPPRRTDDTAPSRPVHPGRGTSRSTTTPAALPRLSGNGACVRARHGLRGGIDRKVRALVTGVQR